VTLTTAPAGYGVGGTLTPCHHAAAPCSKDKEPAGTQAGGGHAGEPASPLHWGQSLQFLDHVMSVHTGEAIQVVVSRTGGSPPSIQVDLRPGKGIKAPRPPWEVGRAGVLVCIKVAVALLLLPLPLG
jgi:hypothetical protein